MEGFTIAPMTIRTAGHASGDASMSAETGVVVVSKDSYKGAYIAIPSNVSQEFATSGLNMTDDFEVAAVPYHEAPNDYGTTITIGA